MVDVAARVAEEDQVAGQQLAAPHGGAVHGLDLLVGDARDLHARLRVGPLDQAGAVEAGLRRRAAPLVRRAGVLLGLRERGDGLRPGPLGHRRGRRRVDHLLRGRRAGQLGRDGFRGGGRDRARRRAGCGGLGGVGEQLVGFVEAELVAAAVLLGGAFDVGDPFAELVGVVDRLAALDALLHDAFGGVEEPVELLVGVFAEAGVVAFPDRDAHLEVAEAVGVAVVDVGEVGLDQGGHHGELGGQAALLGLGGHPRGDLGLGRVVARIGARRARQVHRRGGGRCGAPRARAPRAGALRRRGGGPGGLLPGRDGVEQARSLLGFCASAASAAATLAGLPTAANSPEPVAGLPAARPRAGRRVPRPPRRPRAGPPRRRPARRPRRG